MQVAASARGDVPDELDVRGSRAYEAREAVRSFVDDAALAGLPQVRVIHGRGTGAVRTAVRDELDRHPLVDRSETESADGATVAYLDPPSVCIVNPQAAQGNKGSMAEARSDAELIARAASEPELFGVLFDRHFATIHRYLERRIGADGADELAGEVFRIAFEQRHRFRPLHESALPWLYGLATNLMLKRWRGERRHLRALARMAIERGTEALDGTDERIDARSSRTALLDALASLPQRDRDIVVLIAWEELSYEEAAEALEVPVGTVRSRLNRARRTLRELLGDIGNERVTITCEPQGDAR